MLLNRLIRHATVGASFLLPGADRRAIERRARGREEARRLAACDFVIMCDLQWGVERSGRPASRGQSATAARQAMRRIGYHEESPVRDRLTATRAQSVLP